MRLLESTDGNDRDTSWKAFVERHNPLILSVARSLGGGRDAAMDRYAFVLERLRMDDFARLRSYRPETRCQFTTWLVVVVRRLCLDHHRRKYGQLKRDADEAARDRQSTRRRLVDLVSERIDPAMIPGSPFQAPDLGVRSRELSSALEAALAALAPRDRLLLKLRFESDLTGKEVAEILRLPSPFHVYRLVDRVLGELRASLARAGIVEPMP